MSSSRSEVGDVATPRSPGNPSRIAQRASRFRGGDGPEHEPLGDRTGARPRLSEAATVAASLCALTLVYLRPIWRVWRDHIGPDPGDPVLNLYFLDWVAERLAHGLAGVWSPPFYYPTEGVLALADHLIGPGTLAAPLVWLGLGPAAPYNALLLSSFVLSGIATWYVVRRLGGGNAAGLFAAVAFAFCPYRWEQASHLPVLLAQWIPLLLFATHRLLVAPTWRRVGLFLGLYLLHVSGGSYLAYMVHVPLAALLVTHRRAVLRWRTRDWLRLAAAGIGALSIAGALYAPYVEIGRRLGLERDATEMLYYGASLDSYLAPSPRVLASPLRRDGEPRPENALFPGLATLLAGSVGVGYAIARWARPRGERRRGSLLLPAGVLVIGLSLALSDLLSLDSGLWVAQILRLQRYPRAGVAVGLLLVALGWRALRRPDSSDSSGEPFEKGLLLGGAACFALSLPVLFLPAADWLPGLSGMRVPARFATLTFVALAIFAGRGFDRLRQLRRPIGPLVAVALSALLVVESTPRPWTEGGRNPSWSRLPAASELPEVFRALVENRPTAVLLLPFAPSAGEIRRLYWQRIHGVPTVNGFSGHMPRPIEALRDSFAELPRQPETLHQLAGWGVSHLVVDVEAVGRSAARRRKRLARLDRDLASTGGLTLIFEDELYRLYRIEPTASTPSP